VVINADGAWHWYAASVTLDPSTTQIQVGFELGSGSSADFDDIAVTAGPCANAYAGADQHQTCSGDTPVCSADGSCQAATPPGDMGGGPSSTPDMGGAPASSFPGGNTAFTPSTSVSAEGTPSGTGPVRAGDAGGCSVGGTESERSFAVMLLAFVAVLLAGRRRRA
jgi:MYXO-CTERM domain-containing protein